MGHQPAHPPSRLTMSSCTLFDFCDGWRDELDGWVRGLLAEVARDYDLKEQELVGRYLTARLPAGAVEPCDPGCGVPPSAPAGPEAAHGPGARRRDRRWGGRWEEGP